MNALPSVERYPGPSSLIKGRSLLICAEGFEDRSLSFVHSVNAKLFSSSFVFTYFPTRKSRLPELMSACGLCSVAAPRVFNYDRFNPSDFEVEFSAAIAKVVLDFEEIVVDISVMSKLMIVIVLHSLRFYKGILRIIYSEPVNYSPSREQFEQNYKSLRLATNLPSYGVHDVVRTPMLTSVVMQRSPTIIVAFTSFNEQLIRALLSNFSPTHLFLINGVPPSLCWREEATQRIHGDILNDYRNDNPVGQDGRLEKRVSTLFYGEAFDVLRDIYNKYCVSHRIVLAPTGSKMQAVGCALLKLCCADVHIEYPTPESFLLDGFSSPEIRAIHQVLFDNFCDSVARIATVNGLNG